MSRRLFSVFAAAVVLGPLAAPASAQPIGTFVWQLQPYCNVVTVNVVLAGGVYTLDGWDDQCGTAVRAPVVGVAVLNPNGTVGLGLNIITAPSGVPVHVDASITLPTASGSWSDSAGNGGAFVLGAGVPALGPRPPGGIGVAAINPAQVQARVTGACPAGQLMIGVNESGTVNCQAPPAGGDITGVSAGAGLTGGGVAGDVALAVAFGSSGSANSVARSDHTHGLPLANTAVGNAALVGNTTGSANTAHGAYALEANATGDGNTATGKSALLANTGGMSNTGNGANALESNTSGSFNTAMGVLALGNNTTGSGNLALGNGAGQVLTTGSDNIYVKANAANGSESNTTRLGSTQTRAFIAGVRGITTGTNDAVPVVIDSFGQLGTVSSSRRTKDHIEDLDAVSRAIFSLRPVQFRYTQRFADGTTPVQYGLIAEEVEGVLPALVAYGADGRPETVKYHVLPTLLLAEVQRLERERTEQHARLDQQAREIAALRERLDALQRQLETKR